MMQKMIYPSTLLIVLAAIVGAKRSENSIFGNSVDVKAEPISVMKAYVLAQEHLKKGCIPSVHCMMLQVLKEYNNGTSWFGMNSVIDYVKDLKGWDDITQKRDELTEAMDECYKKIFYENSPKEQTVVEAHMWFWMQFVKFDRCIIPKFASTFGINNQLAEALFPLFSKRFLKTNIEVFMGTEGMAASEMLTFMKENMESFTMKDE